MSIEVYPGDRPLAPPPPPTWGDIAPVGKTATVLRVALADRWVSFPVGQFIHWEHQVAKALYPDADIRSQAFENVTLPTNRFDLAVSNVPFTGC